MAIGALRATESKGIKLPIIGTDGTAEAIQSIIDGDLAGSIAQNPYEMGYKGVENAVKAMKGEKVESRIDSGIDIITSDNAQEKLDFLEGIAK